MIKRVVLVLVLVFSVFVSGSPLAIAAPTEGENASRLGKKVF